MRAKLRESVSVVQPMSRIAAAAITAAGLALGAFAAPATARIVGSMPYVPSQAPVPAGDRGVAWLDDARRGGPWTLWTTSYTAKPRRVQRLVGGRAPVFGSLSPGELAASSTQVALRVISPGPHGKAEPPPYEDVRTLAGRFGQPLQSIAGCRISNENPALRLVAGAFQLRGSLLLFSRGESCRDHIERDLTLGAGSDRAVALPGVFLVRTAGRFIAWLEYDAGAPAGTGTVAVVRDRLTGHEITRVPLSRPHHLSLREDGTLALSLGGTVLIAEPGSITPRELPIHIGTSIAPVPWVGKHLAITLSADPSTLQLIDTNGTIVRRLVKTLPGVSAAAGINDTHVTWLSRGCRSVLINARPLSAPGPVRYQRDRFRCRLRRAGPTILTARRVRLGVSCKSLTIDCSADITVLLGTRTIAAGAASDSYRDGTGARANLHVRRSARHLLRTPGPVMLRITARYDDTDSVRRSTIRVRPR